MQIEYLRIRNFRVFNDVKVENIPQMAVFHGKFANQRKYRVPDAIPAPKEELRKILPEHQQISGARKVAPLMNIEKNGSVGFQQFVNGVRRLCCA